MDARIDEIFQRNERNDFQEFGRFISSSTRLTDHISGRLVVYKHRRILDAVGRRQEEVDKTFLEEKI